MTAERRSPFSGLFNDLSCPCSCVLPAFNFLVVQPEQLPPGSSSPPGAGGTETWLAGFSFWRGKSSYPDEWPRLEICWVPDGGRSWYRTKLRPEQTRSLPPLENKASRQLLCRRGWRSQMLQDPQRQKRFPRAPAPSWHLWAAPSIGSTGAPNLTKLWQNP